VKTENNQQIQTVTYSEFVLNLNWENKWYKIKKKIQKL
jgi:hypothetical protein